MWHMGKRIRPLLPAVRKQSLILFVENQIIICSRSLISSDSCEISYSYGWSSSSLSSSSDSTKRTGFVFDGNSNRAVLLAAPGVCEELSVRLDLSPSPLPSASVLPEEILAWEVLSPIISSSFSLSSNSWISLPPCWSSGGGDEAGAASFGFSAWSCSAPDSQPLLSSSSSSPLLLLLLLQLDASSSPSSSLSSACLCWIASWLFICSSSSTTSSAACSRISSSRSRSALVSSALCNASASVTMCLDLREKIRQCHV